MSIADFPFEFFDRQGRTAVDDVIVPVAHDDCSVITIGDRLVVMTTDFVNANPASISLNIGSLHDVGYLAAIASISDLLGSGATPRGLLLGVRLTKQHNSEHYEEVINGAIACLSEYSLPILGGDTKIGPDIAVYGVGVGEAQSMDQLFLLSRAQPKQKILLSGPIGGFNAAVWALSQQDCPIGLMESCKEAILRPRLPFKLSQLLAYTNASRAGTDLSDGLGVDLWRLANRSNVGAILYADSIPIHPLALEVGVHYGVDPLRFALATGGDYQFLATGEPVEGAYLIGETTAQEEGVVLDRDGVIAPLPKTGHDDTGFSDFFDEIEKLLKGMRI